MSSTEKGNRFKVMIGAIMVISLFASVLILKPTAPIKIPVELQAVLWPAPRLLTNFDLVDPNLNSFNLERLADKWTLLFFGYTNCPDVCPITLAVIKKVYDDLAEKQSAIQDNTRVVFVSVDPARDTPEKIGKYLAYFDESFIGATGSTKEIDNLTRQFSAGYALQKPNSHGDYQVDHTSSIYLIGPDKKVYGAFSPPLQADTIVEHYLGVRKYESRS